MPKKFLDLPQQEQAEIIITISSKLGVSPVILEKDLWVCWALQILFEMPNPLPMAFKGGTSLSKVFDAIKRFSEDIDISLDCRSLDKNSPDTIKKSSNKQQKKQNNRQEELAKQYVQEVIFPYFRKRIEKESWGNHLQLRVEGEKIYLRYPTLAERTDVGYLKEEVLLEFGGRNTTTPTDIHIISPFLQNEIPELEFPIAKITVLSPKRTFWEKATLIHAQCNKPQKPDPLMLYEDGSPMLFEDGSPMLLEEPISINRISRHWYDLAELLDRDIGKEAFNDHEILYTVIKHQKSQNPSSCEKYDDCLQGKFKLIPEGKFMSEIESDFDAMLASGMFYGAQPSFKVIMDRIRIFEHEINNYIRSLVNAPLD